jgi:uncharacterized protein
VKQRIITFLAGGLIALALYGVAAAGPLEDAFRDATAAYQRGDYATALRLIRPLAEQGNASAQSNLGAMYANGLGVAQDYAQAVVWYRKAADQGNALAQFNLGVMYTNGRGVPQDYAQAGVWYRKAADQGYALAQASLGVTYESGQGVPQDYEQAVVWYRKAADQVYAPRSSTSARCTTKAKAWRKITRRPSRGTARPTTKDTHLRSSTSA